MPEFILSEIILSLIAIAVWGLVYFGIVAAHEFGHYLAGLLIGIPAHRLKIRLLTFPQHVALRDGDEWVSPVQIDRYIELAMPLMPTTGRALAFVAGGFILETAALLLWVTQRLPLYRLAAPMAVAMTAIYLLMDVATYLRTRKASLDFSAMCSIAPIWGGRLALAIIGLQIYVVTLL